ncbi:MAG: HAD family hydrolase [Phycisphaerales bacterium]|nr:HAD family hydrolase [Phycisphaerales bacterium]
MLILFDVDGTLITTHRAGVAAMGHAGRALFGPHFREDLVDYAGRLDPLIIRDLLTAHGQPSDEAEVGAFRAAYREHLVRVLAVKPCPAQPCPGVVDLLEQLHAMEHLTIGLLTGNFPETGRIKLEAAGINVDRFRVCAWGSDSPHEPPAREHLPEVAMAHYKQVHGRGIESEQVVVIGDTPHDISCARAHGCRALAVATGIYGVDDLSAADLAVQNLTDTEGIIAWLTRQAAPAR